MAKTCYKCQMELPLECFYKDKNNKDGLRYNCKDCSKAYQDSKREHRKEIAKNYYLTNRDRISAYNIDYKEKNRDKILSYSKNYYIKNRDKRAAYRISYEDANREKIAARKKAYREANPDVFREYRIKQSKDPLFRLIKSLRQRLYSVVKNNTKSKHTLDLLGCPVVWLEVHLESKFYDRLDGTEMTWDNYGKDGWHIDHIKPCASFDLTDSKQQAQCFHWTNLQPLWAEDNFRKHDKIDWNRGDV